MPRSSGSLSACACAGCVLRWRQPTYEGLIISSKEGLNIPNICVVVTSFSVAVAVDKKKTKILCGQLSDRCTTCRRFD